MVIGNQGWHQDGVLVLFPLPYLQLSCKVMERLRFLFVTMQSLYRGGVQRTKGREKIRRVPAASLQSSGMAWSGFPHSSCVSVG